MAFWEVVAHEDTFKSRVYIPPEDISIQSHATNKMNALGTLQMNQYMLIPTNWKIPKCPVNHIGGGPRYDPGYLATFAVYALAKAQALEFGWNNEKAIKWALLRMQAFVDGWFDDQKYVLFKQAPPTFPRTYLEDENVIMKYLKTSQALCSFLPFVAEFQFRVYGRMYLNDPAEYVRVTEELAKLSFMKHNLDYLDHDTLYGSVCLWIDVKRVMKVLKDPEACSRIPYDVFKVRKKAAPVGQTLIALSYAVLKLLKKANWWSGIKKEGGYEDEKLKTVFKKIVDDPWKYHIMHQAYGLRKMSEAELGEVEEGKKLAIVFAPVLQAYVDAVEFNGDLGKSTVLKKFAHANKALYSKAFEQLKVGYNCETSAKMFANMNTPIGNPTSDVEENALGTLQKNQYMLRPNNWKIPECPVNLVGGLNRYKPGSLATHGVYALAKAQALDFGWNNTKAIKWAVLRMQAFSAGWFDNQKFTMFKEASPTSEKTFSEDKKKITKYLASALSLSTFLPLLAEYQFRVYGTSYQKTNNRAEYIRIAKSFADLNEDLLTYMDNDTLFGSVLLWVDVKRPMVSLKDFEACSRFRDVFLVGKEAAPVGQSLIMAAGSIINTLQRFGCWNGIKEAGRYEDEKLITVYEKIVVDPWKYHVMCRAYGLDNPSVSEMEEVEEGNKLAILFAPVLQAYIDACTMRGDLEKARTFEKFDDVERELYSMFRISLHHDTFAEMFDNKSLKEYANANMGLYS